MTTQSPDRLSLGVKLSVPLALTAGATEKMPGFELPVITKLSVWPDSFGPAEMPVAQPATETGVPSGTF